MDVLELRQVPQFGGNGTGQTVPGQVQDACIQVLQLGELYEQLTKSQSTNIWYNRSLSSMLSSLQISDGMLPATSKECSPKNVSFDNRPSSVGLVPNNWFVLKSRCVSSDKCPMSVGMVPFKSLEAKSRNVSSRQEAQHRRNCTSQPIVTEVQVVERQQVTQFGRNGADQVRLDKNQGLKELELTQRGRNSASDTISVKSVRCENRPTSVGSVPFSK